MPLKAAFQRLMKNQKGFRKPMLEAVRAGDLKKIDALVEDGADVNAQFETYIKINGLTYCSTAQSYALFALHQKKYDVVLHLKKHGLKLDALLPNGHTLATAFCAQVYNQYIEPEHLKAMVRIGIDMKAVNARGTNPLHILAFQDGPDPYDDDDTIEENAEKMAVLLDAGVHIDAQDNDGNTALHHTVAGVSPVGDIKFLLERDANATLKNNQGQTAIDVALANPEKLNDPTPMLQEYVDRKAAEIATARVVTTAQGLTPEAAAMLNTEAPVVTFKTQRVTLKL